MKIGELRKDYETYSMQAGDINRKMIYVGVALVWMFKITNNGVTTLPQELHLPLLLFALSFSLEFIQKLIQTLITYFEYCYYKHRPNATEDTDVNEPELLTIVSWIIYYIKFVPTFVAYYEIAQYLSINITELNAILQYVIGIFGL